AARNASSFAFEGLVKPLIFRTNCNDAACISSSVTGGSKLKSVLIFLHICKAPTPEVILAIHAWWLHLLTALACNTFAPNGHSPGFVSHLYGRRDRRTPALVVVSYCRL